MAAVKDKLQLQYRTRTTILPTKCDGEDIVAWFREFDACSQANGWKDENKLKKLPAFLRGRAASHFYAIPDNEKTTYAAATQRLKEALCPLVERENYYALFDARLLRTGEDPSVYKWELEQLLAKADPTLGAEAQLALLSRQFMRGLPTTIRGKLLDHNPTPTLSEMVRFVQRYRAVEGHNTSFPTNASTTTTKPAADIDQLVGLMADLASRQKVLEDQVGFSQQFSTAAVSQTDRQRSNITCFQCGKQGHIARECRRPCPRQPVVRNTVRCYQCQGYGHFARDCANTRSLNFQGASRGITARQIAPQD